MAEDSITLEVVTPKGSVLSASVSEVSAPSEAGEFGVLAGHRPLLAALKHGTVRYVSGGKAREAAIGPGFAEVGADRVVLLVEPWAPAEEIDLEEARDELSRAEMRVRQLAAGDSAAELAAARREALWAEARVEVARRHRQV